jgi:hypothetical protein
VIGHCLIHLVKTFIKTIPLHCLKLYLRHPVWKTIQIIIEVFPPRGAQRLTRDDYAVLCMEHVQKVFSNKYKNYIIRIEIKNLGIDFPLDKIDPDIKKEWFEHIHIRGPSFKRMILFDSIIDGDLPQEVSYVFICNIKWLS